MPRWSKVLLSVGGAVIVLVGVGGLVVWARLPQIASALASRASGRTVTVGTLRISPGFWMRVKAGDVTLANLPGGTRADMARVQQATGKIALWPLLRGSLVARGVEIHGADLLLERVDGQPNWRNGPRQAEKPGGGRADFPTILGAKVDGTITFRTRSGTALVTRLNGVTLTAADAASPASLTGPGAYQDVPIALMIALGSYDQLHDATQPFPTDVRLSSGDTAVHFNGTMTDPLNVDGAKGTLTAIAPTPTVWERVAGADPSPAPSIQVSGALTRERGVWTLDDATGAIGDATLTGGRIRYTEGDPVPDKLDTSLRFRRIDLDRLLQAFGSGGSGGSDGAMPTRAPDPEIKATLAAESMRYGKFTFGNPTVQVVAEPGLLSLDGATSDLWGGQVKFEAALRAGEGGKAGTLTGTAVATGLDAAQLRRSVGGGSLALSGRVDLHAATTGSGETAVAALRDAHTAVVATMDGGSVSAQLVELASTNVAGLFRSSGSTVPLRCMLMVADARGGVARLGPVRLRSSAGTIVARGQVNLQREAIDVVVASEASTTGPLALDVPVRITGSLDDPSIAPAGGEIGRAASTAPIPADLPPALRAAAQANACGR